MITVRLAALPPKTMLASGTNGALLEVPVTVKVSTGLSGSATVNAMAPVGVFSGVVWSFILEMVGGLLTAFTVNTKFVGVESVPSLTVIVMVDVPLRPAAGVITAVRPAPLPPKTILATGISVASDEVADTVSAFGEVSISPTVNAIAPVGVSSFVD